MGMVVLSPKLVLEMLIDRWQRNKNYFNWR